MPTAPLENGNQRHDRLRAVGAKRQGPPEGRFSVEQISGLQRDHAQEEPSSGIADVAGEQRVTEGLRLREPSGAQQRARLSEIAGSGHGAPRSSAGAARGGPELALDWLWIGFAIGSGRCNN